MHDDLSRRPPPRDICILMASTARSIQCFSAGHLLGLPGRGAGGRPCLSAPVFGATSSSPLPPANCRLGWATSRGNEKGGVGSGYNEYIDPQPSSFAPSCSFFSCFRQCL
uniref:Uncharacterized protein n=1 Tax=Prorocentrum minimum TaxID=39449 RepID=E8Z6W9_PROMN|nr:unknown [Prorocentrum minimum]